MTPSKQTNAFWEIRSDISKNTKPRRQVVIETETQLQLKRFHSELDQDLLKTTSRRLFLFSVQIPFSLLWLNLNTFAHTYIH